MKICEICESFEYVFRKSEIDTAFHREHYCGGFKRRGFHFAGAGCKTSSSSFDGKKGFLKGASVADKVIGKAAALLMALGEIKEVHTLIISEPAIKVFEKYNIPCFYDKKVDRIINRTGDGLCPMETLCLDVDEPQEAFQKITDFIKTMKK